MAAYDALQCCNFFLLKRNFFAGLKTGTHWQHCRDLISVVRFSKKIMDMLIHVYSSCCIWNTISVFLGRVDPSLLVFATCGKVFNDCYMELQRRRVRTILLFETLCICCLSDFIRSYVNDVKRFDQVHRQCHWIVGNLRGSVL
jgi:hypothetical protein